MNKLGKQLVNCQIATLLYSTFGPKTPPISLGWYELQNRNHPAEEENQVISVTRNSNELQNRNHPAEEENQVISVTRNSSCNKKLPVTKSDDFYGKFKCHQTN
jgi:hypothetical protein